MLREAAPYSLEAKLLLGIHLMNSDNLQEQHEASTNFASFIQYAEQHPEKKGSSRLSIARYYLAVQFLNGRCPEGMMDVHRAVALFEKSKEPERFMELGRIYFFGLHGVTVDFEKAEAFLRKSLECDEWPISKTTLSALLEIKKRLAEWMLRTFEGMENALQDLEKAHYARSLRALIASIDSGGFEQRVLKFLTRQVKRSEAPHEQGPEYPHACFLLATLVDGREEKIEYASRASYVLGEARIFLQALFRQGPDKDRETVVLEEVQKSEQGIDSDLQPLMDELKGGGKSKNVINLLKTLTIKKVDPRTKGQITKTL